MHAVYLANFGEDVEESPQNAEIFGPRLFAHLSSDFPSQYKMVCRSDLIRTLRQYNKIRLHGPLTEAL